MLLKTIEILIVSLFLFGSQAAGAYGNNFSCAYGKQGACLDYGDKVCSSFAKCVDSDAVCFNSSTCGYKGFVCKSKLDSLAADYDDLLGRCKNISLSHDDLVDRYNELLSKLRSIASDFGDLQSCVSGATTLAEAQACH